MDWEALVWNTPLPTTRKFLLAAIARHADVSGFASMTTLQLAATTGLGSRTVREQMALAEAAGNVRRFPRIGFQISLTQPDSPSGASRRIAYLEAEPPAAMRRVPPHGISTPYMERTSETPSGFSPVISSSSVLSSSNGLENEQLGIEGISNTPAWLTDLRTTPGYNLDAARERRLIQRVDAAAISTQRLCEAATSIAAKWESVKWSPTNKRGYRRIDLTFIAWAKREGFNGNGAPVDVDPLDAYRKSYGRYMKAAP